MGMGNTMCFHLWVCMGSGMGMALPYPCNTIPLPMDLWVPTAGQVPDHMMLLITINNTKTINININDDNSGQPPPPSLANVSGGVSDVILGDYRQQE